MMIDIGSTVKCGKLQLKVVGIMEDFDREDLLNPYDIFVSIKQIERTAYGYSNFINLLTRIRLEENKVKENILT